MASIFGVGAPHVGQRCSTEFPTIRFEYQIAPRLHKTDVVAQLARPDRAFEPRRVGREVEIKGQSFLGVLGALEELRGLPLRDRVRAEASGSLGDGLRTNSLLSNGWYPVAWYRDLHATIAAVTAEGDALASEVGRVGLRRDVNAIYRALFRLLSTTTLLAQSDRIVKMFVRGPSVGYRTLETRPGYVLARWDGMFGFDRRIWRDFVGTGIGALEVCGGKDVKSRPVEGGDDGDDYMVVEATFKS